MTVDEATAYINAMTTAMENSLQDFTDGATAAQQAIFELLNQEIFAFDTTNGSFVRTQPLARKIAELERRIYDRLEKLYYPQVANYLNAYDFVDERNITLQKNMNDITLTDADIKNVRAAVFNQAEYMLTRGVADAYVQPVKFALMQTVTEGRTIKQATSMLKNWNEGELPSGTIATARPTPRLQAYAGQMARDSLFQYNGTVQDNVKDKYKLGSFLYVGGTVKATRPLCRHLVGMKRKIKISEIPQLIIKYPEGTYPDTTMDNFLVYRGGYNCLHSAIAVRD